MTTCACNDTCSCRLTIKELTEQRQRDLLKIAYLVDIVQSQEKISDAYGKAEKEFKRLQANGHLSQADPIAASG
jgi:ribosome recycling factor